MFTRPERQDAELNPSASTPARLSEREGRAGPGGLAEHMKAIVQDNYGPPEVLEMRDIDKPEIGDGQVLIRARAAGVNLADWAIMSGLPYIARPVYGLRKPKNAVRGTDVAGTVEPSAPAWRGGSPVTRSSAGATARLPTTRPPPKRGWR